MNPPDDTANLSKPEEHSFSIYSFSAIAVISTIFYIYIHFLSGDFLDPRFPKNSYITQFLLCTTALFAFYFMLVAPLVRGVVMSKKMFFVAIGFSVLFRLILLPTDLILENDIYRYLWDGHTTLQGVNPYRHAPSDAETLEYRTDYWKKINYPYIETLYPPTLQLIFAFSESLFSGSVVGMKVVMTVFDVGTIILLTGLLKRLKLPKEWSLIYAWSPLVIKEIANSGHADAVIAFLLISLLVFTFDQKNTLSAFTLALLVLTKFFAILLVPLLFTRWRWKEYLVFFSTIVMLYLPFISMEINPLRGFLIFSQEWIFNDFLFGITRGLISSITHIDENFADSLARKAMGGAILLAAVYQAIWLKQGFDLSGLIRSVFFIMAALTLCSPVINAWYLVWIVPLLALQPNRAWLLFTALVMLSYTYYYHNDYPAWMKPVEFGTLIFVWSYDYFFPLKRIRAVD